jgi:hypothetical protein
LFYLHLVQTLPLMTQFEHGRALYYPYIHFRDPLWLKSAALYYDKLHRIVPFDLKPEDSVEAEILKREIKFIEDIDPRNQAEKLAPAFIDFAEKYLTVKKTIKSKKQFLPSSIISSLKHNGDFRIHPGKMAQELGKELTKLGLAKKAKDYDDNFDLEPITGALYMIFLAKTMASERSLSVVTDDPIYQPLIYSAATDFRPMQNDMLDDKKEVLASFVVRTFFPKNINSISIDKLIEFRTKYDKQRRNFQTEVANLAKDFDKVNHPDAIMDYLYQKAKTIDEKVSEIEDGLRSTNIDCITKLFALSVPAWTKAAWALPIITANPIMIPGVIAFGAYLITDKSKKDRNKIKDQSNYSYILSLRKLEEDQFLNNIKKSSILI